MAEVNRAWKEFSNDARKNYIATNEFVLDDDSEDGFAPINYVEKEKPKKRENTESFRSPTKRPRWLENFNSPNSVCHICLIIGIINTEHIMSCLFISDWSTGRERNE